MKNNSSSNIKAIKAIFFFLLMTCLFHNGYSQQHTGTTYYVDSSGDDSDDGLTEQTAWQSIEKVNSIKFQPGDRILFKAGSVWDDATLIPKGSGVEGAPIVIDAYGDISDETNKPRINVNGKWVSNIVLAMNGSNESGVSAGLIVRNISYWEINNLQITNWKTDANGNPITDFGQRNVYGALLNSHNYGVMEHIYIRNLYIRDISGYSKGHGHSSGKGIFIFSSGDMSPSDIPSKFNDLRIENNHLKNMYRDGIVTFAYRHFNNRVWYHKDAGKEPGPNDPFAVPYRSTNVIIRGNLIENIGGQGIVTAGTNGTLVEYNILRGGAMNDNEVPSAGMYTYDADNCVIQYNEVSGMMGTCDGQAFNIDYYTTNSTIQYNYSHDNAGGFLLLCSPGYSVSSTNVVRYNISQNDGAAYGWNWNDSGRTIHHNGGNSNTHIYNNTFYIGKDQHDYKVIATDQWAGGRPTNVAFENNIFIVESEDMYKFFTNNEWPLNYVQSVGTPDPNQFVWKNNAFIGKGFAPSSKVRNTVPTINQNNPLFLPDDASNYFYGAGHAMFGRESAIAAYTPKPGTALTNFTGKTISEPEIFDFAYHLANGKPFNPGPQEWPYTIYKFYNYNPGRDFAGNPVNIEASRQLGAILTSETPPCGGLLDAPKITLKTIHTGVEVTFTPVPNAQKYMLIYGKTHGFGYQARTITKTTKEFGDAYKFVLNNLDGEGNEFFDEYFFTVCAIDAGGKNGYYSFAKRLTVTRAVTSGRFDENPNANTLWIPASGNWKYEITEDYRSPLPGKWQLANATLNPNGSITVNSGGNAFYYGADWSGNWDDYSNRNSHLTDYSVTATIKNEAHIGDYPNQFIHLRLFENGVDRGIYYELGFSETHMLIRKCSRVPNNAGTALSQTTYMEPKMPEHGQITVRVTVTGNVITVEAEENGKFVRKAKYIDAKDFSPRGAPAIRTYNAQATFSNIEISEIVKGANLYRQTKPDGGRSDVAGLNIEFNSIETITTINTIDANDGYAGFIAGGYGVYLNVAGIFVKDIASKSTVASAAIPVKTGVPYTIKAVEKGNNLEVYLNNVLAITAPNAAKKLTGGFSLDMYNATAEYSDLVIKRQIRAEDDSNPYYRDVIPMLEDAVEVPLITVSIVGSGLFVIRKIRNS